MHAFIFHLVADGMESIIHHYDMWCAAHYIYQDTFIIN